MPTYGYRCTKCNHTFEIFQNINDEPLKVCNKCGGELKKLLYPVGIIFKGPGFHVNDYKSDTSTLQNDSHAESASDETKADLLSQIDTPEPTAKGK